MTRRRPIRPSRWTLVVVMALAAIAGGMLCGCGRGNAEVYSLLAESVVRTYLSSEVTVLADDDLLEREQEMRSVKAITGRVDDLAADYQDQLLDEIERRGLEPLP